MQGIKVKADFGSGFSYIPLPKNWKDIKLQLIFTKRNLQAHLQSILFEFVNKNADDLYKYQQQGETGAGTGILEGPGLQIYADGITQPLLDGCINTSDPAFTVQNGIAFSPIKESGKRDWVEDNAQGVNFWYLTTDDYVASPIFNPAARITRADYKQTPYTLSDVPDRNKIIMMSITLYMMIKESIDIVCKIESYISRVTTSGIFWQIIGICIEIGLYVAYLLLLIIASVKLIQDLITNIETPYQTKLCMREVDLFKKMCAYFNLKFVSSIYGENIADAYNGKYVNFTLMPVKIQTPIGDPLINGWKRPQDETSSSSAYGYYDGDFKGFIEAMELMYNANFIVQNGCAYFEEAHHWNLTNSWTMPNEGKVGYQYNYPAPYSFNASELATNYIVKFLKDDSETNTITNYDGTYCMATSRPKIVRNQKNLLWGKTEIVQIPFALARRKNYESQVEKDLLGVCIKFNEFIAKIIHYHAQLNVAVYIFNPAIAIIVDVLYNNASAIIPFGLSNDRVGWMILSADYTGVAKRFCGTQNGLDWTLDSADDSASTTSTIPPTPALVSGVFTGTVAGGTLPPGSVTGTVVSGIINCSFSTSGLGAATFIVSGTIAGSTILYAGTVHGVISGGVFHGSGVISTALTSTGTLVIPITSNGSAETLFNDFHRLNIIDNNQWLIFKDKTIKFGVSDYLKVSQNNVFTTANGDAGKFDRIVWNIQGDEATVDYRIKKQWTNNYLTTISTDNGQ